MGATGMTGPDWPSRHKPGESSGSFLALDVETFHLVIFRLKTAANIASQQERSQTTSYFIDFRKGSKVVLGLLVVYGGVRLRLLTETLWNF